jgi:hypothetical protein
VKDGFELSNAHQIDVFDRTEVGVHHGVEGSTVRHDDLAFVAIFVFVFLCSGIPCEG